jgi:hypothetical protein
MALAFGSLVALFAVLFFTLRSRRAGDRVAIENLDIFSLDARYRPMVRLLDRSDFELVSSAGDPVLLRRLKSQRRAIFRGYLKSLSRDHARLCAHTRAVLLNGGAESGESVVALHRAEIIFRLTVLSVSCKLVLHAVGLRNVRMWGLMDSFEKIRLQAESVSTAPQESSSSV